MEVKTTKRVLEQSFSSSRMKAPKSQLLPPFGGRELEKTTDDEGRESRRAACDSRRL